MQRPLAMAGMFVFVFLFPSFWKSNAVPVQALVVVKELWRYLDNGVPVDWCQIMEQQRRRVLLA